MMLLAILIILAFVAILVFLKMKQPAADDGLCFTKKEALFTPAERSFLGVLEQSLDNRYRVFGKVRLGDIVKPMKGLSNSKRTTAQNKVNQKHVDFAICMASDLAVVGVVELDDKSHDRADRAGRDLFVDRTLADAKIPVIHFSAKKGYALPEVRAKLDECFAGGANPAAHQVIHDISFPNKPVPISKEVTAPIAEKPEMFPAAPVEQKQEAVAPVCPKCESAMVKRQAMKGPHAGEWFWACSTFPKCRQVVAVGDNSNFLC